MERIWLEDFAGTCHHRAHGKHVAWSHPLHVWAWYDPEKQAVVFGGMWVRVPDWYTPQVPDEKQVRAFARKHVNPCKEYLAD